MVVLTITNCPPALRGTLSRWMFEIHTGVYVGKMSAKVRDLLWDKVCENIKSGQATMVYSSNNEQGFEFRTHNASWEIVDFEGISLLKRPILSSTTTKEEQLTHFSKSYNYMRSKTKNSHILDNYVLLDVETTGLDFNKNELLEIGLIKVEKDSVIDECDYLLKPLGGIPKKIELLTGITEKEVNANSIAIEQALKQTMEFIKGNVIIGYNVNFDCMFLKKACDKHKIKCTIRKIKDVENLAVQKLKDVQDYKLETVANKLGIQKKQSHRALDDCRLTLDVMKKLNKID